VAQLINMTIEFIIAVNRSLCLICKSMTKKIHAEDLYITVIQVKGLEFDVIDLCHFSSGDAYIN